MLKLLGGERDEGGCMEERVGINASIQMFLKFAIWKYSQYNILSTYAPHVAFMSYITK